VENGDQANTVEKGNEGESNNDLEDVEDIPVDIDECDEPLAKKQKFGEL